MTEDQNLRRAVQLAKEVAIRISDPEAQQEALKRVEELENKCFPPVVSSKFTSEEQKKLHCFADFVYDYMRQRREDMRHGLDTQGVLNDLLEDEIVPFLKLSVMAYNHGTRHRVNG